MTAEAASQPIHQFRQRLLLPFGAIRIVFKQLTLPDRRQPHLNQFHADAVHSARENASLALQAEQFEQVPTIGRGTQQPQ